MKIVVTIVSLYRFVISVRYRVIYVTCIILLIFRSNFVRRGFRELGFKEG